MADQKKVSFAMWRVVEAARVALLAMPEHRAQVPRVVQIEQELVPLIEAMVPAVDALAMASEQRKVAAALQAEHLEELHRRTLHWLTYVRLDNPAYRASSMQSRGWSVAAVLDRAHRLLTVMAAESQPHAYAERLRAELEPLYERSVQDRDEAEAARLELSRMRARVRGLMVPAFRNINTLRRLLRNSLGATHPHVRGLNTATPKKPKRNTANTPVEGTSLSNTAPEPTVPNPADRLTLVR